MARLMIALALLFGAPVAHAEPVSFIAALAYALAAGASWAAVGMYMVAYAAMYAYSASQKRKAERAAKDAMRDRTVMVRSSEAPHNVIYGETRVSGPLAYACTSGTNSENLHLVVVLAAHEISSVEAIWLNDEPLGTLDANGWVTTGTYAKATTEVATETFTVPAGGALTLAKTPTAIQSVVVYSGDDVGSYTSVSYTLAGRTVTVTADVGATVTVTYTYASGVTPMVRVKKFPGVAAGARDTDLETASGGAWTSAHLGKGIARLHVTLKYDQDIFPNGIPNVSAVVRGKKIYDPRSATTAWSRNAALCVRDYLTSAAGFGAASSEVDDAALIAAANICDEAVNYDATNAHARYTCDGAFTLDASRREILQDLLGAMVGTAVYSGGKWVARAGAYVTPTLDLDDSDLADGSIQVQARTSRRDLFNAVRGQFIDPAQGYSIVDFPPYASATYATEDGGDVVYQDVQLPFTANTYRAQRIAKLILFRARQATVISATWKLPAYALQPSDTCRLTINRYGWTNKVFRVVEREYVHPHQVKLVLQEEASAVYAWLYSEGVTPDAAPNTDLLDPRSVPVVAGLAVTTGATYYQVLKDGTRAPIARLTWAGVADAGVTIGGAIEVQWKRAVDVRWESVLLAGNATTYDILTAPGEVLNVAVRAINGAQVRGEFSFVTATVSSSAQGNVTNAAQGTGQNMVRNAGLRFSVFPWGSYAGSSSQASTFTLALEDPETGTNAPKPYGAVRFSNTGALDAAFSGFAAGCPAIYIAAADNTERMQVEAGKRYEIQVRARTIAGRGQLFVQWYDISGTLLSSSVPSGGVSTSTNVGSGTSTYIGGYDLLWGFATAPANAARATIGLNLERPSTGTPTIFLAAKPLFSEAGLYQTQASAWAEGESSVATALIKDNSATKVQQTVDATGITSNVGAPTAVTLISGSITNDDSVARDVVVSTTISYEATRLSGYTFKSQIYLYDGSTEYKVGEIREASEAAAIVGTVSAGRSFSVAAGATLSYSVRIKQENYSGSVTYRDLILRAELIKK